MDFGSKAFLFASATIGFTCAGSPMTLSTVAFRTHDQDAMVAFYAEAFGATFTKVRTGPIESQFGQMGPLVLKFVPIRDSADFVGFPVHQLGIEVADVERVIAIAARHGGRVENSPVRVDGRIHAAVRDPDGNTLELYGPR